ncbi:MAG: PAS domain S-box protein [Candidatus Thermoplasmatota archaeon]|nr:PAS domain S-box protein [Candidatus Thermoplasmatota archaeon]
MPKRTSVSRLGKDRKGPESVIGPEDRFRILFDTMKQGVVHQALDGRIIMANKAATEILGVDLEDMLQRTSENEEWGAIREDGSPFPGAEHPSMVALTEGREVLDTVMGLFNPIKKMRVWVKIDAVPVFDQVTSKPIESFVVFEDITKMRSSDEALMESNERFRNILKASPIGIFLYELDENDRLILRDSNPAADRILNIKVSDLLGRTLEEAFPGLAGTDVPVRYREVAQDGKPWFVDRLPYEHGDIKGIYEVHVFRTEHRKVAVLFNDVSEREAQLERIMVDNELLDLSPAAISVHDFMGNFLYTNRRNLELHGYTREEFLELNLHQLDVPESEALIEERMGELQKGHEMVFGVRHRRKDGSFVPLQVLTKLAEWSGQKVILSIATDLTDRIKAEELLKSSEARYRLLVENASEMILVAQDGRLKYINPLGLGLMGHTESELYSRSFLDFIHSEDKALVAERHRKRLQGSKDLPKYSFRLVTKNGDVRWVEINAVLIEWEGRPATLNFMSDITDRKRAEDALAQSEEYYRTLISTSPDPIIIYDLNGNILYASESTAKNYGVATVEEFLACIKNIGDLMNEENRRSAFGNFRRTLEDGSSIGTEYDIIIKDGSHQRIQVNSSVLFDVNGNPTSFLSIIRDITGQKRAEEALKESEERYRTLLNNLSDAVIEVDMGSTLIYCSPQIKDIFGYEPKEVLGKSFLDFIHPDDLEIALGQLEIMVRKKEIFNFEVRTLHKDGGIRHVNTVARLVNNKDGSVSLVGVVRDVSDRILSRQQIESEKNRAEFYLDLLSHDIGNIHQGLQGWTALARSSSTNSVMRETALQHIDELEKRSVKLVRNVLLLSRLKDMKSDFKPIDLVPFITRSIKEVKGLYGNKEMKISFGPSRGKALVSAEPVIEEVFFNLLHNAVKFQNQDPVMVDISLGGTQNEVVIEISDHGMGIADEQKTKIFDRHIRGSSYTYSGIGLSLVKELVTRYGGSIVVSDRVEGVSGQGAKFTITLPRHRT